MADDPIITFRAGLCDLDESSQPYRASPIPTPGYVYLYKGEDELIHFCWRDRNTAADQAELDLVMIPEDGHFVPYRDARPTAQTNGRIFVLKFSSSSQRYLFWMQSKSQARGGDASQFSPRDLKIAEIVDRLLQGDEVDAMQELVSVSSGDDRDEDQDEPMEDIEGNRKPHDHHAGGGGGAGPDATGGDVRQEGESSREGGADGARAASSSATDAAAAAVRNLLDSLQGAQGFGQSQESKDDNYPYLSHLLPKETTLPMVEAASEEYVDTLLGLLPPAVVMLAAGFGASGVGGEPSPDAVEVARDSMDLKDKKALLEKVLRSPQFHQSLASLTLALRDGGLPGVADALGIKVENGGYMKGGAMPLGGSDAIKAFVEGVRKTVEEK